VSESESRIESRIESYRESLRYSLKARFFLRSHVGLILLWTSFVTWLVDFALLKAGMSAMMLRYPPAILAGYAAFLIGVRVWLEYSGIREYLNEREAEAMVKAQKPYVNQRDYSDWSFGDFGLSSLGGDGCLVVIAIAAAGFLLFWGLGAFATQLFADVVLEVILAAGLLKGLRKAESSGWLTGAWGSTKYWLLFVLVAAIIFAACAQVKYPDASTAAQVFKAKKPLGPRTESGETTLFNGFQYGYEIFHITVSPDSVRGPSFVTEY
jgi:hypothetical protein